MFPTMILSAFTGVSLPPEVVDHLVSKRVVVVERQVKVSLGIREGDPLGSRGEGTQKHLADPVLIIGHKKTGLMRAGGRQTVVNESGDTKSEPVGIEASVTPVIRLDGKIQLDCVISESQVNHGRGVRTRDGFTPGIDSRSITFSRVFTPGERAKVRVSSRSDSDQTWVELEASVSEPEGTPVPSGKPAVGK